jgi:hypothetical protein
MSNIRLLERTTTTTPKGRPARVAIFDLSHVGQICAEIAVDHGEFSTLEMGRAFPSLLSAREAIAARLAEL